MMLIRSVGTVDGIGYEVDCITGQIDHRRATDSDGTIAVAHIAIGEIVITALRIDTGGWYGNPEVPAEIESVVVRIIRVHHVGGSGKEEEVAMTLIRCSHIRSEERLRYDASRNRQAGELSKLIAIDVRRIE